MHLNDQEIRQQLEEEAILGELAGAMVHEFNNFLNTLLLQVTMMETTAPAALGPDLVLIRQEGNKIAKLIKNWQHMKKPRPGQPQTLDFNQIIRDLILDPSAFLPSGNITLELTADPHWVQGALLDLRHLCMLLIQSALKSSGGPSGAEVKVIVRTQKIQQQLFLTILDNGPALAPQVLAEIFDPVRSARSGLELAACKTLARRLRGRLYAENTFESGIAISFVTPVTGP